MKGVNVVKNLAMIEFRGGAPANKAPAIVSH